MKVEIYSSPVCGFCKMTKEFFAENKIEYTDYDVTEEGSDKAQEVADLTGQLGVPVVIVTTGEGDEEKKEIVIGFDKPKLEAALGIK